MNNMLDTLHQEHINISRLMDVLEKQVRLIEDQGQGDLQLISDIVEYITTYPDLYHHPREDLLLELLRHKDKESITTIDQLLGEHKTLTGMAIELAKKLGKLNAKDQGQYRKLTEALRNYVKLTRSHMDIEESRLFPRARQVLTDADWTEVDRGFICKDDPLFGRIIFRQYQSIYDSIIKQSAAMTEKPKAENQDQLQK